MSLEGEKDLDVQFGDIIPCDCSEGSYGHIYALVDRDCSTGFSLRNSFRAGHLEESDSRGMMRMIVEGGESNFSSADS